jgi:LysR family transcriptional regulator, regulator for bpeEF and oprC
MDQLLALRVFVRIADAGTFARAADSLDMPKPTVTKLIQNLENHLGVRLLQRTTRRVTVTPEGAAYYERASRLVAELDDMDAAAANARAKPRGRLRVEMGSSLANLILIPALQEFCVRYPDIELELGVSDRIADLIGEGVDCVIRGGELAESTLIARRIAQLRYITCASPAYLRSRRAPKQPRDIEQGHSVVNYMSALTGRPFPLHFHRGEEKLEIRGAGVSVNESTAHLTALLAGLGLGQTFHFMAQSHLKRRALVPLLAEWTRPPHSLHVVYPPNRHLNARVRVFVDWTVEVFGAFGNPD